MKLVQKVVEDVDDLPRRLARELRPKSKIEELVYGEIVETFHLSPRSPKSVRPISLSILATSAITHTFSIQFFSGGINFIPALTRSLRSLRWNDSTSNWCKCN